MKRILIISEGICSGGVEKSLVEFLKNLDHSKFEIDLLLITLSKIPVQSYEKYANVITFKSDLYFINTPLIESLKYFCKKKSYNLFVIRLLLALESRIIKKKAISRLWTRLQKQILIDYNKSSRHSYFNVIAFKDGLSVYMAKDVIKQKYYAWNHVNYDDLMQNEKFDLKYFESAESVIAVSEYCKKKLISKFKNINVEVIYNYLNVQNVISYSNLSIKENYISSEDYNIVTVARLTTQKGINTVVETMKLLVEDNINCKWYVIGDGGYRKKIEKLIKNYKLESQVILCGMIENPYPYIRKCDLYVQPSKSEGFGLTVMEARMIGKAIIASDIEVFKEQIFCGHNGFLVEMNPSSFSNAIRYIMKNEEIREKFEAFNHNYDYELLSKNSINRFNSILEGE